MPARKLKLLLCALSACSCSCTVEEAESPLVWAGDDACLGDGSGEDGACALSAMQLRGRRVPLADEPQDDVEASAVMVPAVPMARRWSAKVSITAQFEGVKQPSTGDFVYDSDTGMYRFSHELPGSGKSDTLCANIGGYHSFVTLGDGATATCIPSGFLTLSNPFDWLSNASSSGSTTINGTECDLWSVEAQDGGFDSTGVSGFCGLPDFERATVCIAHDGVPRRAVFKDAYGMQTEWLFHDVVAERAVSDFALTPACVDKLALQCPFEGIVSMDLYRVHGAGAPHDPSNRNAADAPAALELLCGDSGAALQAADGGSEITHWSLRANSSWGIYRKCYYKGGRNLCEGFGRSLGRQAVDDAGDPTGGQCSENNGSWYTVPREGECDEGAAIGTDGCTWGDAQRLQTIDAVCLRSHVCGIFGVSGQKAEALAAFRRAFTSGECPASS